jgi:RING finger protein 113A
MSSNSTSPSSITPVVFFKRSTKGKTSTFRKRATTHPPTSDDDDSDDIPSGLRPTKKRKLANIGAHTSTSAIAASASAEAEDLTTKFTASSRDIVSSASAEATRSNDWYDEESLLGKKKKETTTTPVEVQDGTYRGASASYQSFIKKQGSDNGGGGEPKGVGPMKAPANVRTITVTDYAPDVCKDYKQTGFCGFGDTCKFLHAREDYAAGWKLDREWEIKKNGGRMPDLPGARMGTGDWRGKDNEKKEEEVPFKCVICKEDYKNPAVTKCGHYFCEKCAVDRYRKNPSCKICGKRTDGVFNAAKSLQRKLEIRRKREEEAAEKEKGEDDHGKDAGRK